MLSAPAAMVRPIKGNTLEAGAVGAKTGLLVYADGDAVGLLRRVGSAGVDQTAAMMRRLYPGCEVEEREGSNLGDGVYPPKGTVYAAAWPGVEVIGDQNVMIDFPPNFRSTSLRQVPAADSYYTPCTALWTGSRSRCGRTAASSAP